MIEQLLVLLNPLMRALDTKVDVKQTENCKLLFVDNRVIISNQKPSKNVFYQKVRNKPDSNLLTLRKQLTSITRSSHIMMYIFSGTIRFHKILQVQHVCNIIGSNNQIIYASLEKIEKNQKELMNLDKEIQSCFNQKIDDSKSDDEEVEKQIVQNNFFSSSSSIIQKIFGRKLYRFKIKAISELPKTIYKQRNLHVPVQLTTIEGKLVKNSNLIHLCIAVCDQQGKWIVDQNDQFFIQGKIEMDLYLGECQFKKIYPKDISRHYPGGKINIIIYAKPSILISNQTLNKGQHVINCEDIEPLLFSNILIKAKKKLRF